MLHPDLTLYQTIQLFLQLLLYVYFSTSKSILISAPSRAFKSIIVCLKLASLKRKNPHCNGFYILKYNLMEISSPDNNLEKAFLVLIHHCYLLPPLRFPYFL
jgi:hypothetical protein